MVQPHIVVTGDSGFIGRRVLNALRHSGGSVTGLHELPQRIDLLEAGSIVRMVEKLNPDVLVHAAWTASSSANYRDSAQQDLWPAATMDLIHACLSRNIRPVVLGSIVEAGPTDTSPYGRARQLLWANAEHLVAAGHLCWLRIHYVFDPTQGHPLLFKLIAQAQKCGLSQIQLKHPWATHDFIHVDDVANAIYISIQNNLRGLVDVGSGTSRSVAEIVEAMGLTWQQDPVPSGVAISTPPAEVPKLTNNGWAPVNTLGFLP